jgi:hypothetical protein
LISNFNCQLSNPQFCIAFSIFQSAPASITSLYIYYFHLLWVSQVYNRNSKKRSTLMTQLLSHTSSKTS